MKKEAGKETFAAAFPLHPPEMDDEVEVGGGLLFGVTAGARSNLE